MTDKDFLELKIKYEQEQERRRIAEQAKIELQNCEEKINDALINNGLCRIEKIQIGVTHNVADRCDGNGGWHNTSSIINIQDFDLFKQCMDIYVSNLKEKYNIVTKSDAQTISVYGCVWIRSKDNLIYTYLQKKFGILNNYNSDFNEYLFNLIKQDYLANGGKEPEISTEGEFLYEKLAEKINDYVKNGLDEAEAIKVVKKLIKENEGNE